MEDVLRVMAHYDADYLLLDANNASLQALYRAPESEERLLWLTTFGDEKTTAHLFARAPGPRH
jgi:hypothetical protein